ncbi:copper transpport protein [Coemansia biformis]|uniref:Copper transport protein n=1 Tax=Coemansia biformis TaxID=1286918 RepID=A0A9W8CZA7_9FUNG|nr:copper transpport protein [Coemansia biformis]
MVPDTSKPSDQLEWTHEIHMGRPRWFVADHIYELVGNYERFVPGVVPIPAGQHPDSAFSDELKKHSHIQLEAQTTMDMPDHGGHGGHGGNARPMCAMNMSLNWSTDNVCVLFDFWRINSGTSLAFSWVAVFLLGYLYELSRARVRRWELALAREGAPGAHAAPGTPLVADGGSGGARMCTRWKRALFYGLLVAYSYSLMLIFMTYNGFLILAVIGGAVAGHYAYSTDVLGAVRGASCH